MSTTPSASRPVAVVLRPGKTPGGVEVRAHLRRLVRHIRKCWPKTRITFRGDGHYARPEAMNGARRTASTMCSACPARSRCRKKSMRRRTRFAPNALCQTRTSCAVMPRPDTEAKSWSRERRAVARIEATPLGLDIRFVVTNLECGSPEWIYDSLYCARGQAENLIKLHKTQLASDRTSCRSAIANQVRLVLHTAAYWLMLTVRDAIPKQRDLAKAEFSTLRLRLIKIAARVIETARTASVSLSPPAARRRTSSAACPAPSPRSAPEQAGQGAPPPLLIPPTRHQKYRSVKR